MRWSGGQRPDYLHGHKHNDTAPGRWRMVAVHSTNRHGMEIVTHHATQAMADAEVLRRRANGEWDAYTAERRSDSDEPPDVAEGVPA